MFNWSMLSVLIVFIVGGLGGGTLMGGVVEGVGEGSDALVFGFVVSVWGVVL